MGGSGKSPLVEYISNYLIKNNKKISIISRGYKRDTTGLIEVSDLDDSRSVGDEPMQFYNKYKNKCRIIVSENRNTALSLIENDNIEYAILDDAFQNRTFLKHLDILVTSFNRPFYDDNIFPLGRLRENKKNVIRADILIFSNCPENLSLKASNYIKNKSRGFVKNNTPILFSIVKYQDPIKIFGRKISNRVVVISSIAYPESFYNYIKNQYILVNKIKYPDHYSYKKDDIIKIVNELDRNTSILTTEKDAVKLCEFKDILSSYDVYYVPIEIKFLYSNNLSNYLK